MNKPKPITDTDRINWLEAHPLPTEVHGGSDDGHVAKAWAIAAHSGTLRDAIDAIILRPILPNVPQS
jgi:hypothetical protein